MANTLFQNTPDRNVPAGWWGPLSSQGNADGPSPQANPQPAGLPPGAFTVQAQSNPQTVQAGNQAANGGFAPGTPVAPPSQDGSGGGGQVTAPPIFVGGFPQFSPVNFPSVKTAPFNYTDPATYAGGFANFQRGQINTNYSQAQGMALGSLSTQLQGLQGYAPAAAAISRGQTSLDNQANQRTRTSQVNAVLPDAGATYDRLGGTLSGQASRANSYASGNLPDTLQNAALELGIRSRAADRGTFAGFGGESAASHNLSDTMSAEQRFQIAQYGEGLLGQNTSAQENLINNRANLMLAPTQYSQTGQQISPNAPVSAGQALQSDLGAVNESTLLPPSTALSTTVGQNQFTTQLEQQTRQFNAQGQFNASEFNSTGAFDAALGAFDNKVNFANATQAANQHTIDVATGLQTQLTGAQQQQAGIQSAQNATQLPQIATSVGAFGGAVGSILNAGQTGTTTALPSPVQPAQVPASSPVGGVTINTTPQGGITGGSGQPSFSGVSGSTQGSSVERVVQPIGSDGSSPSTMKFSPNQQVPSGYTPIIQNTDGSVSAARNADWSSDIEKFAKYANVPPATLNVKNAAIADRNLSNSAGLSYVPVPGMKPIAVASNGQQVYSLKSASEDGNYNKGGQSVSALSTALTSLGISDPATHDALNTVARTASDPAFLSRLDAIDSRGGDQAVTTEILKQITGGMPNTKTDAGQQLMMGASRIGQLWSNLSPSQKSLALASLANAAAEHSSGTKVGDHIVPGTQDASAGPLRSGDVFSMSAKGVNGWSAARNWNQLSDVGGIAASGKPDAHTLGSLGQQVGLLGYGAQGAAAQLPQDYLKKMGAQAAPELGIGAAVFQKPNHVPSNYTVIRPVPTGGVLAIPKNLAHTSTMNGATDALAYERSQQIAAGKHPAQRMWGNPPTGAGIRGSAGGSAFIAGLRSMQQQKPELFNAVIANSLFKHQMGAST